VAPRKAVQQELTREMILDAARELFVTKGYQHVSMREIAKKLKYSHGAIYYHFKNKAELFYALVAQDFSLLDQKLEQILKENNIDSKTKLEKILLGFLEFGINHQHHYELMFLVKDDEVKSYLQQEPNNSYDKFAAAIKSLCGPHITLQMIWSVFLSLHGFIAHYMKSGLTFTDVQPMAKAHVKFLMKGLQ
jgi:AcrR family transcriptional regulator